MSKKILVIQGPNLNLLGEREPGIYGSDTFESINNEIVLLGKSLDIECKIFQSNYEGAIIDEIHNARKEFSVITSYSIHYTKLYEGRENASLPLRNLPGWPPFLAILRG